MTGKKFFIYDYYRTGGLVKCSYCESEGMKFKFKLELRDRTYYLNAEWE